MSKSDIEKLASDFLLKNGYPICGSGNVKFSEDREDPEAIEYFTKNNIASVSFRSKYLDVPEHKLDPGVYIAYVNMITGKVDVPPHM